MVPRISPRNGFKLKALSCTKHKGSKAQTRLSIENIVYMVPRIPPPQKKTTTNKQTHKQTNKQNKTKQTAFDIVPSILAQTLLSVDGTILTNHFDQTRCIFPTLSYTKCILT